MVERGYIWAGTSPPPAAEPTLQANDSEARDSRPPSPSASELSHGSSNRDVSHDSYSSAGETASDSGSSPGMPDLQPRGDNPNSEMMDLCSPAFSDPPALTTSSLVVRLWKECHRAEQILAGATEDDGAGIHDDPLTRYLACHTRLRQLLPPTATSPATSDSSPVPDGDQLGVPPAAQRVPIRAHSTTPQTTARNPTTILTHTLPPLTFTSALPVPAQRRTQLVRPRPARAPPTSPHVTATGYWRVYGFTHDGTEALAFYPHTHTHITKPRVQRARVADDLPALPWLAPPRSRVYVSCSTIPTPAAQRQAATGQHHSNSRSPDHSQPSPKSSVALQLERQPVGQPATQPHEATPAASRALSTHPRPASCSRTTRTVAIAHALTRFFTCIDGHAHEHLGLSARLWHVGDDGVEFGAALDQLRATRATPE